ncbi:hypothetical protein CC79DRAFT_1402274 [Sarocladium strictum]
MACREPDQALLRVEQGAMAPNGYVRIGSQNFYNHDPLHQSGTSSRDRMTNLIAALDFDQRDLRQHSINSTMAHSCQWLNECDEYSTWVQSYEEKRRLFARHGLVDTRRRRQYPEGNQLLWIKGKPGVGKSTLMKFALLQARKRAQESNAGDHVFAHFFHARGVELERSIEGLYRTFLAQLLEASSPDLIEKLPQSLVSLIMRKRWDIAVLKELLDAVLDQRSPGPIIWFVDALDECDVDMIVKMMHHFNLLLRNAASQGRLMHLCMASRHYPDFSINYPHLNIVVETQRGHLENISAFIDLHLSIGNSYLAQNIRSNVKFKARGVFIWTALVVDVLLTRYSRTAMLQELERVLDEIPADLSNLFSEILTKDLLAKETNAGVMLPWRHTTLCLQLVLYQGRPIGSKALIWALTSIGESDLATIKETYSQIIEGGIERYIGVISRGLVEIIDWGYVQFIHQSVQDFLRGEEGFRALVAMEGLRCTSLASYELFCHGKLRDLCAKELFVTFRHIDFKRLMILGEEHSDSADEEEYLASADDSLDNYPFLKYAAHRVLWHANEQQRLGSDQQEFLQGFDRKRWFDIHGTVDLFSPIVRIARSLSRWLGWVDLLIFEDLTSLLEDCQLPELVAARESSLFALETPYRRFTPPVATLSKREYRKESNPQVYEMGASVVRVHLRRQQKLRPNWYPMFKRLSDKMSWNRTDLELHTNGNRFLGLGSCNRFLDLGSIYPESGVCPATFFLLVSIPLEVLHVPDPAQLEKAAYEGLMPTVQYLVDQLGFPIHDLPFTTSELLLQSCAYQKVDDSRWLLEIGASVDARGPQQMAPLHIVCRYAAESSMRSTKSQGLLKALHDAGIDLNAVGEPPLDFSSTERLRLHNALMILRTHKPNLQSPSGATSHDNEVFCDLSEFQCVPGHQSRTGSPKVFGSVWRRP